jgi:hypothetical protein
VEAGKEWALRDARHWMHVIAEHEHEDAMGPAGAEKRSD